jgi:hypothetical protein
MGIGDKNFHMGFEDVKRGFLIYAPLEGGNFLNGL